MFATPYNNIFEVLMKNTTSIGIDVGHSSVKVSVLCSQFGGASLIDQMETVVRDWKQLSNPETAKAAESDTVVVNGRRFFVGRTAVLQSRAEDFSGQSKDWINSIEHDALLVGAWKMAQRLANGRSDYESPGVINLVMGLPTALFFSQKDALRARATKLITPLLAHYQRLNVYIQSQSLAPLFTIAIDEYGVPTGKLCEDDSWGSVEIGHYTTDFSFQDRGQEIDEASTSSEGVISIYQRVKEGLKQAGYLHDLETISKAVSTQKIKIYGNEVDVSAIVTPAVNEFATVIKERTNNLFKDSAQRMDGIVIAGGGASISGVGSAIQAQYPNATILDNPRFSVANGLSRFGLMMASM